MDSVNMSMLLELEIIAERIAKVSNKASHANAYYLVKDIECAYTSIVNAYERLSIQKDKCLH